MRRMSGRVMAVIGVLALMGCSTTNPTEKGAGIGAATGAAAGAALGAIIGHQSGNTGEGALIGAGAGAVGGALIGGAAANAQPNKFCPKCGKVYTRNLEYCPDDGTPLRLQGTTEPAPASTTPSSK